MVAFSVVRQTVVEATVNVLAEATIRLPTDVSTRSVARVQRIYLGTNLPDQAIGSGGTLGRANVQVAVNLRQGLTTMPEFETPGTIARGSTIEGLLQDTDGGGLSILQNNLVWDYTPHGILIADSEISLYVDSALCVGVRRVSMMMLYTLERVDIAEFMAALSLLENLQ